MLLLAELWKVRWVISSFHRFCVFWRSLIRLCFGSFGAVGVGLLIFGLVLGDIFVQILLRQVLVLSCALITLWTIWLFIPHNCLTSISVKIFVVIFLNLCLPRNTPLFSYFRLFNNCLFSYVGDLVGFKEAVLWCTLCWRLDNRARRWGLMKFVFSVFVIKIRLANLPWLIAVRTDSLI